MPLAGRETLQVSNPSRTVFCLLCSQFYTLASSAFTFSYMDTVYLDHVHLLLSTCSSPWPSLNTTSSQFQVLSLSLFLNNPLNPINLTMCVWVGLPVSPHTHTQSDSPRIYQQPVVPQLGGGGGVRSPSLLHPGLTDLTLFKSSFPQTGTNQPSQLHHSLLSLILLTPDICSTFGLQFTVLSFPHFPDHGSSGQFSPFVGLRSTLVIL